MFIFLFSFACIVFGNIWFLPESIGEATILNFMGFMSFIVIMILVATPFFKNPSDKIASFLFWVIIGCFVLYLFALGEVREIYTVCSARPSILLVIFGWMFMAPFAARYLVSINNQDYFREISKRQRPEG